MDVQLQLTKRVLKEFVTQQSRSVGQTRRRRPKTLELQEQLSTQELPKLAEADLAESPPLLLSPGPRSHSQSDPSVTLNQSPRSHSQSDPSVTLNQSPRSHSQSDPQVTLNQSNVAQAHVIDDDKTVADVVQRLKIIARKFEEKSTQGEPSSHLTQIYSLLNQDLHLSWEGVAELFMAMFNALRSLAKQNPETILDKIQETVNKVIDAVNDWVFQNGGWSTIPTVSLSNSSSRCDSPVTDHTSTDHQPPSAQTNGEGTASAHQHQLAATAVGVVWRRSRDTLGAPHCKTPLGAVRSCVDLTHRTPPGSPLNSRGRACSDPNVSPLSHCPIMFAMGLAKELFDIACQSIWDESVPPSPDSQD